ncbi:MAG: hypothetical protein Ta2B_05470 [Termitinemataceae bacterium]|nr:MAG: hypothetical protein Ta2B_05470 [Termitinemataceae bacterium]
MSMRDYSRPVRRSLVQRDLMLGIPPVGLMLLLIVGLFFVYVLSMEIFLIPIVIGYIAMRILTKKDPYFVDIILDHIMQKEKLIP